MPGLKSVRTTLATFALALGVAGPASAQCMLANPSFEHPGTGGQVFAGWSQFGPAGFSTDAPHGARAARITGPDTHAWDVSGYWQSLTCVPGQRWSVSGLVSHSVARPLTGGSAAIVNIEWRDAGGGLLSYESHPVADPATPPGAWRTFGFESQPAPAGTASIHFVLGALQGPDDPAPEVAYDVPQCVNAGPPTLESLQWNDFPGGRTVDFGGRSWRVKGPGYYGPGPNRFDDSAAATWVDGSGRLHLTIRKVGSLWYSSELALTDALGYGDYVFTTRGRLDLLDKNAVLGLFLWEYGPCYDSAYLWWNAYNEIDVEFSRWGNDANAIGQFVAQPASTGGNAYRFDAAFADDELTSHAMRWLPDRVEYRSWRGGPEAESAGAPIASWVYSGADLPRPEHPRVHLNLWRIGTVAAPQEVVLDMFTFRPACPTGQCGPLAVDEPATAAARLGAAAPNPFAGGTTIRYSLATAGEATITVYDVAGRRVRELAAGTQGAGEHTVRWDGRDEAGRRVNAGVYLCRMRAGGAAEIRRLVVLR